MSSYVNPCGGRRWQTLPDGFIEIEGEGVRMYEPGSTNFELLMRTWDNWSRLFQRAARKHGIPVAWLPAIATMETGAWSDDPAEQATIASPAGAIGIMQIMPATARMFGRTASQMLDPESNIDVGAELIRRLADREDWELPRIGARYNSGKLCDPDPCRFCNEWALYAAHNYPRKIITWNNTALAHLDLEAGPHLATIVGVGTGLVGIAFAAAIVAGYARPPDWLRRRA